MAWGSGGLVLGSGGGSVSPLGSERLALSASNSPTTITNRPAGSKISGFSIADRALSSRVAASTLRDATSGVAPATFPSTVTTARPSASPCSIAPLTSEGASTLVLTGWPSRAETSSGRRATSASRSSR